MDVKHRWEVLIAVDSVDSGIFVDLWMDFVNVVDCLIRHSGLSDGVIECLGQGGVSVAVLCLLAVCELKQLLSGRYFLICEVFELSQESLSLISCGVDEFSSWSLVVHLWDRLDRLLIHFTDDFSNVVLRSPWKVSLCSVKQVVAGDESPSVLVKVESCIDLV